jgi:hypothetical protein
VIVNIDANRAGGPAVGATVSYMARVDGVSVAFGDSAPVDDSGKAVVSFSLPNDVIVVVFGRNVVVQSRLRVSCAADYQG